MARYTGPSCRQCRREGQKLFLKGERCYSGKIFNFDWQAMAFVSEDIRVQLCVGTSLAITFVICGLGNTIATWVKSLEPPMIIEQLFGSASYEAR